MKMPKLFVLTICVPAAAGLAACGATQQLPPAGNAALRSLPAGHLRPQHRSWMAAGQSRNDLLYVSNGNGEVTIYRYWQHTLVGVLTDFTQPNGECVDTKSHVYITDYAAKQILEFAHGGTKPIKKFDDSPDSPYTCSVDPTNGNLAVANDDGTSSQGNIAIWNATGERTTYTDSKPYNFIGCAYDGNGNLLVTSSSNFSVPAQFSWLPEGGAKLIDVSVPGPSPSWRWYVTGIQWDGKFFAVDDYYVYRVALLHGQAYYVGSTSLTDATYAPYAIYNKAPGSQGTEMVGGVYTDSNTSFVYYWYYPAGGDPYYSFSHGLDHPFGVAISLKTT